MSDPADKTPKKTARVTKKPPAASRVREAVDKRRTRLLSSARTRTPSELPEVQHGTSEIPVPRIRKRTSPASSDTVEAELAQTIRLLEESAATWEEEVEELYYRRKRG